MPAIWNPWHGCRKYSAGCANCYVYRRDGAVGRDAAEVKKTAAFGLPLQKDRKGEWKLPPGETVYAVMTSDFFLEEADGWRPEVWRMIKARPDLDFTIITKRIARAACCLPDDWGDGYENVTIGCTCESAGEAANRLPIFLSIPIARRFVIAEPLLGPMLLEPWLRTGKIASVTVGGESGEGARPCDYDWVLDIRAQCARCGAGFHFHQTGLHFFKDGRLYTVPRKFQQSQAARAGIDLL